MDASISSTPSMHALEIYCYYQIDPLMANTFTARTVNGIDYQGIPVEERIPTMKYAAGEGNFGESTIRDAYLAGYILSGEYVQTNVYQVVLYGKNRITQRSGYMGVLPALQSTFKQTAWQYVTALETQNAQNKGWLNSTERTEIESYRQ